MFEEYVHHNFNYDFEVLKCTAQVEQGTKEVDKINQTETRMQ